MSAVTSLVNILTDDDLTPNEQKRKLLALTQKQPAIPRNAPLAARWQ